VACAVPHNNERENAVVLEHMGLMGGMSKWLAQFK